MPSAHRVLAALVAVIVTSLAACTAGGAPDPTPRTGTPQATSTPDVPTDTPTTSPTPDAEATPTPTPEPPVPGGEWDRARVSPMIAWVARGSAAGTVEVAGWVPEVIEEGGTCTATVVGEGVAVEGPAYADASSTSCALLVLPIEPAGQTIVLSYSSVSSYGESEPVQVTP